MRILFVISSLSIGGEQRAASIITDYLVSCNNKVDLICFQKNDKSIEFNSEINVFEIKDKSFKNLNRILYIREKMKIKKYDIVIGFGFIPSVLTSFAKIFTNIPVIVCERNDPGIYTKSWKLIRSIAYHFSNGAIFQTKDAMMYFRENKFKNRVVIHNPVSKENLPNRNNNKINKTIVNTSRLTPAKNHKILIEAFYEISSEFPDYKLEIYGDGPTQNELNNQINALNLNEKVTIFPSTKNVLDKIKNSEVFVLCSNHEGFPNSLVEALSIGIPSISTDCRIGGPKEMITHDFNGLLISVNDVDDLVFNLRKLIQSKSTRTTFSNNSLKIKKILSIENIGKQWQMFINEVVENAN